MARPPRGRRAGGALHTIEERYRLAMLATQDVIWDWDMVTDEVVWSEAVLGVFGYPANEIPRQLQMAHQWWIAHLHPEDAERIDASIQAFLRSGGDLWSTEYCFRRADGSYATVYDHGTVVRNGTRTPLRMVRALSDITARQQAEEALRLHMTQQAAIAAFGQEAIRSIDLAALMQEACAMLAHILHVDYCEVSELLPGGNKLLLRTGPTLWRPQRAYDQSAAVHPR